MNCKTKIKMRDFTILLSLGTVFFLPLATVSASPLSDAGMADLGRKLEDANQRRSVLDAQVACFSDYITEQRARSAAQQQSLGVVLYRQHDLTVAIEREKEMQRGLSNEVNIERSKVDARRSEYERVRSEQQKQANDFNNCLAVLFWIQDICNIGRDVFRDLRLISNAEADLRTETERLHNAERGLFEVNASLERTNNALSQAQAEAENNTRSIREIETQISRAQAVTATMSEKAQAYRALIIKVNGLLKNAKEIISNEDHDQIAEASAELDHFKSSNSQFVADTELGMPEDAKQKCSR